jgi:hypothetical protein
MAGGAADHTWPSSRPDRTYLTRASGHPADNHDRCSAGDKLRRRRERRSHAQNRERRRLGRGSKKAPEVPGRRALSPGKRGRNWATGYPCLCGEWIPNAAASGARSRSLSNTLADRRRGHSYSIWPRAGTALRLSSRQRAYAARTLKNPPTATRMTIMAYAISWQTITSTSG